MIKRNTIELLLVGFLVILLSLACGHKENSQSAPNNSDLYDHYRETAVRLVPRIWPELNWSPDEIPEENDFIISRRITGMPNYMPISTLNQRVWMAVSSNNDVFVIANSVIRKEVVARRAADERPTLTIPEVLKRAYRYLDLLEQDIPAEYAVEVWYGSDGVVQHDPVWWVFWQPTVDGVYYDDSFGKYERRDYIYMIFHEELGLCHYRSVKEYPSPRSMEVTLLPARAAEIAAPLVADVMKTPYFGLWRAGVKQYFTFQLRETKLLISEPNWMLDRHRSIFLENDRYAPEETRLCWRVEFKVSVENKIPNYSREHYVWIFIDAKTGECIGANFD